MYCCKVIPRHKLNNIIVDNDILNVIDFVPDADMELVCANDPSPTVDLICSGCIIYSIATWQTFSYDYFEERWLIAEELPPTRDVRFGDSISNCWEDKYATVAVALFEDFIAR
jgi:hypothetical protein